MGRSIIETVIDTLRRGGIRAEKACPGKQMPAIGSMATAVQLVQLDQSKETAVVLVSVLVPASAGAAEAEDAATKIYRLLKSKGGVCRQEKVEYFKAPELFSAEVYATFSGQETANGWVPTPPPVEPAPEEALTEEAPPTFTVEVNATEYPYVVSFRAFREVSKDVADIEDATWCFWMEEVYPLDVPEKPVPVSAFSLEVIRTERTDFFGDCTLTAQTREIRADGQHQIWEGRAAYMATN